MKKPVSLLVLITLVAAGGPSRRSTSADVDRADLCELVESPVKYNGSRVTVRAVYNYGYEWQELVCTECRANGRTWFAFNPDAKDRIRKQLKKAPRHQGIISGRFTGVFHGTGGPYGDGTFRFEFEVEEVSDIHVLVRDWKTPLDQVGSCKSMAPLGR